MNNFVQNLEERIDAYLESNWENIVSDIDALVSIESCESLDKAAESAPYGPGPRAALDAILELANNMGFEAHDLDGYIGYADFPGETKTQLGIIGHIDVVPAGPGWSFPPFEVTRKDGYLIGRGVIDDKGPTIVALHALKFWKDMLASEPAEDNNKPARFPNTVRFLFGANEETGMADVTYYQQRFEDPAFLITPDAQFPVCYGEKGMYGANLYSTAIQNGHVLELKGGMASNAVPGQAHAVVRVPQNTTLSSTENITVTAVGETTARIDAQGKSAHASLPEGGISAIKLLIDYFMDNKIGTPEERAFFAFEQQLLGTTDGSGIGVAASDEDFGSLTLVGGTLELQHAKSTGAAYFVQSVDSRIPTTISPEDITARLQELLEPLNATCEVTRSKTPFLMGKNSPAVQALLSAYNEATGELAEPFTMGGATYARMFTKAASFGVEKPWIKDPEWVGGMHGPDEGVSEEVLKQTFKIYALTLPKLMQIDW